MPHTHRRAGLKAWTSPGPNRRRGVHRRHINSYVMHSYQHWHHSDLSCHLKTYSIHKVVWFRNEKAFNIFSPIFQLPHTTSSHPYLDFIHHHHVYLFLLEKSMHKYLRFESSHILAEYPIFFLASTFMSKLTPRICGRNFRCALRSTRTPYEIFLCHTYIATLHTKLVIQVLKPERICARLLYHS